MIITTSNVLSGKTPTVTKGVSTDLPQNITDPDFSAIYVSSSQDTLIAEFGAISTINYVAVAGINIKGNGSGSSYVRVMDGYEIVATINVSEDQVTVVSFADTAFDNLRIVLKNIAATTNPILTYAAAGNAITIPNGGESSGYNRQFLNRNLVNKTTINNLSAPIATLQKKKQAKGTLTLPNMTKSFSEDEWQTFLDFAEDNYFFIKEQDDIIVDNTSGTNASAYLCYELGNNKVTAHAETRSLNNISVSFKVYNGL